MGKLWRVSQPHAPGAAQVRTTYADDGSGRTLSVTAPDGSVTQYSGPALTSETNPENGTVQYTYNAAHQVLSRTDARKSGD